MAVATVCAVLLLLPTHGAAGPLEWTWIGGSHTHNEAGIYGTPGEAAATNIPGARQRSSAWSDSNGHFWLFGGFGNDIDGNSDNLNDLWRYNPATGLWTWMGGSDTHSEAGIYGTLGEAAATNIPGARYSSHAWTDSTGTVWLFGGFGYDIDGNSGRMNDLWRYNPTTGMWTWMGGSDIRNQAGIYGTQGTPAAANIPGARKDTRTWTDSTGTVWLFGGDGRDSADNLGRLNDLWRYDSANNLWTWMGGSDIRNQAGIYGTKGAAAPGNMPGARQQSSAWSDSNGHFWLFGGIGNDSNGDSGHLNDLWRYNPTTGLWTWMSGSNTYNQSGVYGTQGVAHANNIPGGRSHGTPWLDSAGDVWLFGGFGRDKDGTLGRLNDLWRYNPATGLWIWMGGANIPDQAGIYGTQGAPDEANIPGARQQSSVWQDSTGNVWLFGGFGYDIDGNSGRMNDLWRFDMPACDNDGDCPVDFPFCVDGECVECRNNADCDDGLFCTGEPTCVDGVCIAGADPCAAHELCDEANRTCVECFDDDDCDPGFVCDEGVCVEEAATACLTDDDCDPGFVCDEGVCVEEPATECILHITPSSVRSAMFFRPVIRVLRITGSNGFDPGADTDMEPIRVVRPVARDDSLIILVRVPPGLDSGPIPVSVGACTGTIQIR